MNCMLMPIHPKYMALILNGEKTIEVRKFNVPAGTLVYAYCTIGKSGKDILLYDWKKKRFLFNYETNPNDCDYVCNGLVVASFVVSKCDKICSRWWLLEDEPDLTVDNDDIEAIKEQSNEVKELNELLKSSCLTKTEIRSYSWEHDWFYALHISELKIFDRPKEISDFFVMDKDKKGWHLLNKAPQSRCYVKELI